MLKPAFADVSMYCKMLFFDASLCCNLFNFVAISSRVKQRSPRSLSQLVATMKIHTSSCSRISETSLTHFWIESNCVRDETWNAMMAMWQSRMYEGMLALNRSCPDVSHTCRRMSFFPRCRDRFREQVNAERCLVLLRKLVFHGPPNNGCLAGGFVAQKNNLEFRYAVSRGSSEVSRTGGLASEVSQTSGLASEGS